MNLFGRVVGQKRIKEILSVSIGRNRMAHAYLFYGPAGVGMDAFAIAVAKGLHCQNQERWGCHACGHCQKLNRLEHPGFIFILPVPSRPKTMKEDKYQEVLREKALSVIQNPYQKLNYQPELRTLPAIGIDQIRSLKRNLVLKTPEGGYRVVLISHADQMTVPASNSLLKILEEPPGKTVFLLTTSAFKRILTTIISRCQLVHFDPLRESEIEEALVEHGEISPVKSKFIAGLSGGSLTRAFELLNEDYDETRSLALTYLECCLDINAFKRIDFADRLCNEMGKNEMIQFFQVLLMWLRDIFILQTGDQEKLLNRDRIRALNDFCKKCPSFNVERAVRGTEQAIDFIEKNVYLHLIIQALSQEIHQCRDA